MWWNYNKKGYFRNQIQKPLVEKGKKEVNITIDYEDDVLLCFIKKST